MRIICLVLILTLYGCGRDSVSGDAWEVDEARETTASAAENDVEPEEPEQPPIVEEPPVEPSHGEQFVGIWWIEQPYHALYEATWYQFEADGTLVELESMTYGHAVPTGTVGRCDAWSPQDDDHCADFTNSGECVEYYPPYCVEWSEVSCTFGDSWSSAGEQLSIRSRCTDGSLRTVLFDMSEVLAGTAEAPVVLSVDGEAGWYHNTWQWRWTKCPSDDIEDCQYP